MSVDLDEAPDRDSSEWLMLAMHLFVEQQRLDRLLLDMLRRSQGEITVEWVSVRPLDARKA